MAAKRDIKITKGDDYSHVVTITNKTGPINITGRTYTAEIKKVKTQALADVTITCTVTNGAGGEVTLTIPNSTTSTMPVDCSYWDLLENASGILTTILAGKVTVTQDVT